ncbi:MAG: hypothetical protein JKY65_09310 [Planctomycetes bacterium]|nr:hypothetical protein [Planctomycetota bacterium]
MTKVERLVYKVHRNTLDTAIMGAGWRKGRKDKELQAKGARICITTYVRGPTIDRAVARLIPQRLHTLMGASSWPPPDTPVVSDKALKKYVARMVRCYVRQENGNMAGLSRVVLRTLACDPENIGAKLVSAELAAMRKANALRGLIGDSLDLRAQLAKAIASVDLQAEVIESCVHMLVHMLVDLATPDKIQSVVKRARNSIHIIAAQIYDLDTIESACHRLAAITTGSRKRKAQRHAVRVRSTLTRVMVVQTFAAANAIAVRTLVSEIANVDWYA